MSKNISRKDFLRFFSWVLTLPFAFLAGHSISRHFSVTGMKVFRFSANLNRGITFQDEVIIVNDEKGLSVFSSRCPHLGCRISALENNQLVCPCHGSRFDLEGKNLKGPANKSLQRFEYNLDAVTGEMVIQL